MKVIKTDIINHIAINAVNRAKFEQDEQIAQFGSSSERRVNMPAKMVIDKTNFQNMADQVEFVDHDFRESKDCLKGDSLFQENSLELKV